MSTSSDVISLYFAEYRYCIPEDHRESGRRYDDSWHRITCYPGGKMVHTTYEDAHGVISTMKEEIAIGRDMFGIASGKQFRVIRIDLPFTVVE